MNGNIRGKVQCFLMGERIKKLRAQQKVLEMRFFVEEARRKQAEYEERYNHNHDPESGRFTSADSGMAVDKKAEKMYHDSGDEHIPITAESIDRVAKPDIFADDELNVKVQGLCKSLLAEAVDDPPFTERAYSVSLADLQNGAKDIQKVKGGDGEGTVTAKSLDGPYLSIHNHPSGGTLSTLDVKNFMLDGREKAVIVVGNGGQLYVMGKSPMADTASVTPLVYAYASGKIKAASDSDFWKGLNVYGIEYKEYT